MHGRGLRVSAVRHAGTLLALLVSSACVETFKIPPAQLHSLNGYTLPKMEPAAATAPRTELPYRLTSTDGKPVKYDASKQLVLLGADAQPLAPRGPFEAISVSDNTIDVVPVTGTPVQVPLRSIQSVEVVQPSPERTSQLIIAASFVALLLAVGITLTIAH
jgi:hypothetical protein